jgi:hypothetical protein
MLPVHVVERDAAPWLPLAVHDDDFKRLRRTVARKRRDGLTFRVQQLDEMVRILDRRNMELVEIARLAPFRACSQFFSRIQYMMISIC